jgi:hypothetical protein
VLGSFVVSIQVSPLFQYLAGLAGIAAPIRSVAALDEISNGENVLAGSTSLLLAIRIYSPETSTRSRLSSNQVRTGDYLFFSAITQA